MKLSNIGQALCVAASTYGLAAQAGDDDKVSKDHRQTASQMQGVTVLPKPGEPGHGWQYFTDVRQACAVVISPKGDYYYSRGHGLKLVYTSVPTA